MPRALLKVELLQHTVNPEELISLGARLCYAGGNSDTLREKISSADQRGFLEKLMQMGHLSVLEHASFSFLIEGVSRTLLAQLTRHRIASFSVQSQRYVSYEKGFGYIVPPAIEELGEEAVREYETQMQTMHQWYVDWQQKLGACGEKSNEDARFVLPNACETRLVCTMNLRELRHFFALRMCMRAQWEIRAMAEEMFKACYKVAPILFADAGPECLRKGCSEGAKSCGQMRAIKAERTRLRNNEMSV